MTAGLALTVPLGLVLLALAGVAAVTARGGWIGSLRRDGRLGVRSPAAASSDAAFADANRVAAPVMGGAAAVGVVTAAVVLIAALPVSAVIVVGLLGVIGSIALMVAAGLMGERAARNLPVPARAPQAVPACSGCSCGGGGCAGLTRKDTAAPAAG